MAYAQHRLDRVRNRPPFDNEHKAADDIASGFEKAAELFVHLVAYRALRAMLENNNGMGFRMLQKLLEIFAFSQFRYHDFRLTDSIWNEERRFAEPGSHGRSGFAFAR